MEDFTQRYLRRFMRIILKMASVNAKRLDIHWLDKMNCKKSIVFSIKREDRKNLYFGIYWLIQMSVNPVFL